MNTLYIIGNGFDKAQGLNTSYPEFYNFLQTLPLSENKYLGKIIESITDEVELWSDMEIGLGKFTKEVTDSESFEELYFYLHDKLQEYLKEESLKFSPSDELKSKFVKDFFYFRSLLTDADAIRYGNFFNKNGLGNYSKGFDIMTFNYTNTIETLFSLKGNEFPKSFNGGLLNSITHIHGVLDDSIILGVDNEEQIDNEQFKINQDIKDFLIKEQTYSSFKTTNHINCEQRINNANVIILYGVSLGSTDQRWWKIIGENLVRRKNLALIHFIYAPDTITPTRKHKIAKLEREQQYNIMKRMCIDPTNFNDELKNRLFFIVNSNAFKI